ELGAEALINHAELEPDDSAADDEQALRHLAQVHRFARADHALAVELEAGDLNRRRTGSDDDRLVRGEALGAAVLERHFDAALVDDATATLDERRLVRLQERAHAARHLLDDAVLPILHLVHVDVDVADGDAGLGDVPRLLDEVRVRDQRLRGDAAPIHANTADLFLFD